MNKRWLFVLGLVVILALVALLAVTLSGGDEETAQADDTPVSEAAQDEPVVDDTDTTGSASDAEAANPADDGGAESGAESGTDGAAASSDDAAVGGSPADERAQQPFDVTAFVWEFIQGEDDGVLLRMAADGTATDVVDFQPGLFDNRAMACSQDYWAQGGDAVALYTGAAEGTIAIYPFGDGAPVNLGTVNRMACAGPASFQLSANGQLAAYINYDREVAQAQYPHGILTVVNTQSGDVLTELDWATAFTLADGGVLTLRIFPDGKGNGTEADLDWWDSTGRRTLVTLEPAYPDEPENVECSLRSADVVRQGETAYVLAGQWCNTGQSSWRLLSVPMSGGAVTEITSGTPGGGFFPESFTTNLIPVTDGSGFLVTLPSGLRRNTASLAWLTLDGTLTPVGGVEHVLTDHFGDRLAEGRHLQLAPDGGALAFVTVDGNGFESLHMLSLSAAGSAPVLLEELGANQRVFQYVWSGEGAGTLFFASGSIESSSLQRAAPDGSVQRVERGRFFRVATNYAGDKVAAAEWFANPDRIGDDLFHLMAFTTSGQAFTLKEGGQEHNQMIPLALD